MHRKDAADRNRSGSTKAAVWALDEAAAGSKPETRQRWKSTIRSDVAELSGTRPILATTVRVPMLRSADVRPASSSPDFASDALSRWLVDDVAPGVRLRGLSGKSETGAVWWSGSSFATAVATGLSVTGAQFEVENGITYWQDRSVNYANVNGLQFKRQ